MPKPVAPPLWLTGQQKSIPKKACMAGTTAACEEAEGREGAAAEGAAAEAAEAADAGERTSAVKE
jgi:hypothetical protein